MKRVSRDRLRMDIWIALSVVRSDRKRALGIDIEHVRQTVTDDLVERIMGPPESETVMIKPDLAGPALSPYRGRWGHDEPYPHLDLPFD